ncbi:uncharacterized protein LOC129600952 [Paramacrobiotus metropolitanus]|uniref:uncharacterized protein LOC129600952 n=1 Tax=Paramacrobiotus metropolitanus TaxID=2943436 RepID=UPI002446171C|nr:uncharacterized protein LOC129600952 [Paramacrobiotus metropolitanus]
MLPTEILKEIFLSLDIIDQQRCRRICLCGQLLNSAELYRAIHVHMHPKSLIIFPNSDYGAFACIVKYFTPSTHSTFLRDIITFGLNSKGGQEVQSSAGTAVNCIQHLLERTGAHLDRVVLFDSNTSVFGRHWTLHDFFNNLAQAYSRMAPWCPRIIWRSCSLSYCHDKYDIVFRIPDACFSLRALNAIQIWDLFEEHLNYGKQLEVEIIAQWIEEHIKTKSAKNCVPIIQILEACQCCDPRPSICFNRKWTLDNLDSLETGKLNRLCLYALSFYMLKWSGTFSVNQRKM